jgi:hypothetical protein
MGVCQLRCMAIGSKCDTTVMIIMFAVAIPVSISIAIPGGLRVELRQHCPDHLATSHLQAL